MSEATDKEGKRYAIKCINKLIIKNVTNIQSEVEISLLLDHKHIIKCYEIYEDIKTISFVLELIEGGDLLDYITKSPIHHLTDDVSLDELEQSVYDEIYNFLFPNEIEVQSHSEIINKIKEVIK